MIAHRTKLQWRCLPLIAGFLVASAATDLRSDIIYGDFEGDAVIFKMVTESSDREPTPLYGEPTVDGNSLDFPVTGFTSTSLNGESDFMDGRLRMMVESKNGRDIIEAIQINEFGAFTLLGLDSTAFINAIGFVQIGNDVYDGSFFFQEFGDSDSVPNTGPWEGGFTISFPKTNKITFVLDNQLFTRADANGVAFIDKKGLRITVIIPEPSAAMLLVLGSCALLVRRRR